MPLLVAGASAWPMPPFTVLVVSWLSRLPRFISLLPHVSRVLSVLRLLERRLMLLRLAIFSNLLDSASDEEGCCVFGGTILFFEGTGMTSAFCRPVLTVAAGVEAAGVAGVAARSDCEALR